MDKNKLVLPASILLGCIILGGFYFWGQNTKINKEMRLYCQKYGEEKWGKETTPIVDSIINKSYYWSPVLGACIMENKMESLTKAGVFLEMTDLFKGEKLFSFTDLWETPEPRLTVYEYNKKKAELLK